MNVFIKRKMIIFLVMVFILGMNVQPSSAQTFIAQSRPSIEQWCFDFADVLSPEIEREINNQGRGIQKAFDVDFVVAVIPSIEGQDIDRYTLDLFSRWEIGKSTQGKKGILILVAKKEQRVRIEVGYDLEAIYTDAYIGQVEREILKEFLEQAEWGRGFLAAIESFLFRIYNKDLMQEVRGISSPGHDLKYYSQGAGAANVFDFGAALRNPLPETPAKVKEYFSAQPTPELAFQRYMELNAKAVKHNNDLTLFTELSNKFWRGWKHTSGQARAEAEHISGKPYVIKQKDNHAVVFFPEADAKKLKKTPMYFLAKTDQGWQIDINTMTRAMRCVGPGWWMVTDLFHPYSAIIMEDYNLVHGFLTQWGDSTGYHHFFILGYGLYDENESGYHIGVYRSYEEKSNLKTGDRVMAINGEKIRSWKHFWSFFDDAPAGSSYTFDLIRNGKRMIVKEKLMGYPDGFALFRPCLEIPRRWIGVYMVQSLDREWRYTIKLRDQGKFRYSSLCSILEVYPNSPADRAGLKPNDLIVDYGVDDDNGEIMPYDIIKLINRINPGEYIELTILRDLKHIMKIKVIPEKTWHKGYF